MPKPAVVVAGTESVMFGRSPLKDRHQTHAKLKSILTFLRPSVVNPLSEFGVWDAIVELVLVLDCPRIELSG
jgi:hypothetical protein